MRLDANPYGQGYPYVMQDAVRAADEREDERLTALQEAEYDAFERTFLNWEQRLWEHDFENQ